jgi:uncharacterized protein (UPF0333 family)
VTCKIIAVVADIVADFLAVVVVVLAGAVGPVAFVVVVEDAAAAVAVAVVAGSIAAAFVHLSNVRSSYQEELNNYKIVRDQVPKKKYCWNFTERCKKLI